VLGVSITAAYFMEKHWAHFIVYILKSTRTLNEAQVNPAALADLVGQLSAMIKGRQFDPRSSTFSVRQAYIANKLKRRKLNLS